VRQAIHLAQPPCSACGRRVMMFCAWPPRPPRQSFAEGAIHRFFGWRVVGMHAWSSGPSFDADPKLSCKAPWRFGRQQLGVCRRRLETIFLRRPLSCCGSTPHHEHDPHDVPSVEWGGRAPLFWSRLDVAPGRLAIGEETGRWPLERSQAPTSPQFSCGGDRAGCSRGCCGHLTIQLAIADRHLPLKRAVG